MSLSTKNKSIDKNDSPDFEVFCSPNYPNAFVNLKNAWFSLAQKVYYAELCIEGLETKNYSEFQVLGKGLYDLSIHKDILKDCRAHLEDISSYNLKGVGVNNISLDDLSGLINSNIPNEIQTDFCTLLEYDVMMKDAINLITHNDYLLTQNSTANPKKTNIITSFTDTAKEIPNVIYDALFNPKNTLIKATSMTVIGSLLLSGFASAFDGNHHLSSDSADTVYQDLLHQLDLILPDLPDILPIAAAQPVTQSVPTQPTFFGGYGKLDGSIVNSSEVSLTALVNETSYDVTTWFTDNSGNEFFTITIPYDATNAEKNVTFFCLDEDTAQTFMSEENGTMVSGASNYPFNVTFTDDQSPLFNTQDISVYAKDPDNKVNDVNISTTSNEPVTMLVKEDGAELFNSTVLNKERILTLNNQTDGTHIYQIIISDKNNNQNTTQLSATIDTAPLADTTPPTLLSSEIEVTAIDGDTLKNDVTVSITTDELTSIKIENENGLVYSNTSLKTDWSVLLKDQTEGDRVYNITFSDSSNNNDSIELSILIDTTLPNLIDYLVSVFDRDGDGNNDDVKLKFNLTENASIYTQIIGTESNTTNSTFLTNPILYFNNLSEGNYNGFDLNMTDLSGNQNNLSILFPINITKKVVEDDDTDTPPVDKPGGSGGGGGGGGGGSTGEKYENIIFKDSLGEQIINNMITIYNFNNPENPINYLEFMSSTNKGSQNLNIQVLKYKSALVDKNAEDIVAMYFNMYLGLVGTENGLDNINLEFGLIDNIISDKSLDLYSIRLMYFENGKWVEIETEYKEHDKVNGEYVFSVELDHISGNYAIVGKDASIMPMLGNMGDSKPDIQQSKPDNSDNSSSFSSTNTSEDTQDPADEEPEATPGINPLTSILPAAYHLLSLRKKKKN
ncbi:MAG: PGF-pre-PGF domain-containing protein [DPANN group archaeon]|nr:PGF-pre-PGF domain-containing protein [DPANN group archaeon]